MRPDLIFLDSRLPDMDGFELCRRLRGDPLTAFIPIVLVTTPGQESAVWKALTLGVKGYLVRPLDAQAIVSTVQEVIH
jgi:two-component system cell cycle response regulator